jgi:phage gpG-like protein
MIRVTLIGTNELKARFEALYPRARDSIFRSVSKLAIGLQTKVRDEKLSGEVLKNRTGTLRRSIIERVEDNGNTITGIVGTNLSYARIHEFGGTIKHPGGTAYLLFAHETAVFLKNSNPLADRARRTKPHDIPMPERSYLRSSLKEYEPVAQSELSAAVKQAVEA